jgi:glycosyltransferase involved in cell wall biosynthesis
MAGKTAVTPRIKPRITVFTRSYPPAYLRGGPARSLHALVEGLASEFAFSVITSAYDDCTTRHMPSIEPDLWATYDHARVWYSPNRVIRVRKTIKLLMETEPHLVYVNSLFDCQFAILPLLIARIVWQKVPVVLAPRGELSTGALMWKPRRKRAFLRAFKCLKLHKSVTWHASTTLERTDIERSFGADIKCKVAMDLRTGLFAIQSVQTATSRDPARQRNSLVFFSRIVPKKNLLSLIRAMQVVGSNARLSVAGPIEDPKYWRECLDLISRLRDPAVVKYVGTVPSDNVVDFLSRFELFVFPTLGENFGHVVLEALAAGTPVIVGCETPWAKLDSTGAVWTCDPCNPEAIARLIDRFLDLREEDRIRMRTAARNLAVEIINNPSNLEAHRSMLQDLTSTESQ